MSSEDEEELPDNLNKVYNYYLLGIIFVMVISHYQRVLRPRVEVITIFCQVRHFHLGTLIDHAANV